MSGYWGDEYSATTLVVMPRPNVTVKAAEKTPFQLQQDIRKEFVPRYYKILTVTVRPEDRFFFVGGEVRTPSRQPYYSDMSVLRAIDTAGGFTDFANKKNIELRRSGGLRVRINWNDAIRDAKLDPLVYPNDQIVVHKKAF